MREQSKNNCAFIKCCERKDSLSKLAFIQAMIEASKETPLAFCGNHQIGRHCRFPHAQCYLTAIFAFFVDTEAFQYTSPLTAFPPLQKHFPALISVDGI